MKNTFDKLKKISADYKTTVDELAAAYQRAGQQDYQFNDEIKAKRLRERNADFNNRIAEAAEKAQSAAAPEIAKLRGAIRAYITDSTDPATLQTLQALLTAGVELSSAEIQAFAQKGGYGVLRLLEKPSKGHIKAPDPVRYERELQDMEQHFRDIGAYRGGLAGISPDRPWGQASTTGSVIMGGMIDKLPAKLDEMAERWAALE